MHIKFCWQRSYPYETNHDGHDEESDGRIFVHATPSPTKVQSSADEIPSSILYHGPDLRDSRTCNGWCRVLGYDESSMNANPQEVQNLDMVLRVLHLDTSDSAVLKTDSRLSEIMPKQRLSTLIQQIMTWMRKI
jgi:hypothetical protein